MSKRRPFNAENMGYWLAKARKVRREADQLMLEKPYVDTPLPCEPRAKGNEWAPIPGTAHIDPVGRFASVAFGRCDASGNLLKGQDDA